MRFSPLRFSSLVSHFSSLFLKEKSQGGKGNKDGTEKDAEGEGEPSCYQGKTKGAGKKQVKKEDSDDSKDK